jgi:hypothetical protein
MHHPRTTIRRRSRPTTDSGANQTLEHADERICLVISTFHAWFGTPRWATVTSYIRLFALA